MINRKFHAGRGVILLVLLCVVLICQVIPVEAAGKTVIPGNDISIFTNTTQRLNLTRRTLNNYRITNSSVTTSTKFVNGQPIPLNGLVFCCGGASNGTWTNLVTLNFINVGSIGGRQLDCTVVATRLNKQNSRSVSPSEGAVMPSGDFMYLRDDVFGLNSSSLGRNLTLTFKVFYHDTGATVNLPFVFMGVDIDSCTTLNRQNDTEAIDFYSGFSGNYFVYSKCNLVQSGTCFRANQSNASNLPGSNINGVDQWLMAGVAGVSNNGQFAIRSEGYNCGTPVTLFCNFLSSDNMLKTPDKPVKIKGETVVWSNKYTIHKLYANTFTPYTSLEMYDVLPDNLEYKNARVLKGSTDITNKGVLSYDESSRTVRWVLSTTEARNLAFYDGSVLNLEITCDVLTGNDTAITTNNSGIKPSGLDFKASGQVEVQYKIDTSYEGEGEISPSVTNIPIGESRYFQYTPAEGWYLQKIIVDDTEEITGEELVKFLNGYTFKSVNDNHKLHAVFKPIPELTLSKEVTTDAMSVFGSEEFSFEISGRDYLGYQHTWCKTIEGTGSATWQVPAGVYTCRELENDRFLSTEVVGILNADEDGVVNTLTGSSHILFKNSLVQYDRYGHNNQEINLLK